MFPALQLSTESRMCIFAVNSFLETRKNLGMKSMHLRSLSALLLFAALLSFTVTGRQLALSQTGKTGGAIGYASLPVRRTGIRFPRLTSFRDQKVVREVNRQIDEFTKDFGCSGKNSYYKVRSKVAYAD